MGNNIKPYGIERIFDKSIDIIDLRMFLKSDTDGYCNVFFFQKNNSSEYTYLMILFLDEFWCLGIIINKEYPDKYNPNIYIITVDNGRKYIVTSFLEIQIFNGQCKFLNNYLV